jgi:hypothetical protein
MGLTTPPWKKLLSRNLKKQKAEKGQGPHRAVEPVMMMMMMY